ncbi:MAG: Arm DNA-binding domain-containing protein, partial [Mesorhizobium sp.]
MTTRKLTALALATLPEGDHADPHCPGLILRVQKRRRTWVFRTRHAGRRLRDRLGYFPAMGLKEARLAAGDAARRAEAGLRAVPETVVHPRTAGETLGQLLDDYERMRIRENHKLKTFHRRIRDLRRGLAPWLAVAAKSFAKADLR